MHGIEQIQANKEALCAALLEGLINIPGVSVYGTQQAAQQTATVGFNIEGVEPSTVGERLDEEFDILCRVGLHCAPSAHHTLGTFPDGCVLFGLGAFNSLDDVRQAVVAVQELAKEAR